MSDLLPNENELVGNWILEEGQTSADETCRRIEGLINGPLTELAKSECGWMTLYQDPTDGRYWEHIYPHSDMHGGGPPTLRWIAVDDAKQRYEF